MTEKHLIEVPGVMAAEELGIKLFDFYGRSFVYNTLDSYFDSDVAGRFSTEELDEIATELADRAITATADAHLDSVFQLSYEDIENIVYEIVDDDKYADKFKE